MKEFFDILDFSETEENPIARPRILHTYYESEIEPVWEITYVVGDGSTDRDLIAESDVPF